MSSESTLAIPIKPNHLEGEKIGRDPEECRICGVENGEEDSQEDENNGEGRKANGKKVDPRPSQIDVGAHMRAGHVPFRNWYHHCIAGRGMMGTRGGVR